MRAHVATIAGLVGLIAGSVAGCRSEFDGCDNGTLNCACFEDETCGSGLTCDSGTCVVPGGETGASEDDSGDGDSAGSMSAEGSTGDGDGTTGDGDTATGDGDGATGDGDGTTSGDGDGDGTTTGDGDGTTTGDGDGTTSGDGDGDGTTTGDGDGTTSGDGDGTTTGDGDGTTTGDGDGTTTGDGDGTTTGDGDGTSTGDGDGTSTGDGDGTSTGDGDGTSTGDGDGTTTGDGDGATGDGDGATGDGDGATGDGDGATGDGDGATGDGDGATGDGDGATGDGDGATGDGDGATGDGDGATGDGDGDGVDLPPVVVSITPSGPAGLPNVTLASTVTFTVDATDDIGVDRVEFFLDSTAGLPFHTDSTPPYEAQYVFSSEDDGTRTFYARAYDTTAQTDEDTSVITVAMATAPGGSVGQWIPVAAGTNFDAVNDVAVSPDDGAIFAVGRTWNGSDTDGWYGKFDGTTLVPQWNGEAGFSYDGIDGGSDSATAVATTAGGLVIAGTEFSGGDQDVWLRRLTNTGAEFWTSHFEGTAGEPDYVEAVTFLPNGNIMLVGRQSTGPGGGQYGAWISVVDTNGDEVWHNAYDDAGTAGIWAEDVVPQPDGTAIVVGNYFDNMAGEAKAWVAKFSTTASGDPSWERTQTGPGGLDAEVFGASLLPGGGIVFTGLVESGGGQVWLRKYDGAGTPGQEIEYDPTPLLAGHTSAEAADIDVDVNGRIVVAGKQCCANDPWAQRLGSDYTQLWSSGATATSSGLVNAVTTDANGRPIVGGYWSMGGADVRLYVEVFQP